MAHLLAHLLAHTPGFEDIGEGLFLLNQDELLSLEEYLKRSDRRRWKNMAALQQLHALFLVQGALVRHLFVYGDAHRRRHFAAAFVGVRMAGRLCFMPAARCCITAHCAPGAMAGSTLWADSAGLRGDAGGCGGGYSSELRRAQNLLWLAADLVGAALLSVLIFLPVALALLAVGMAASTVLAWWQRYWGWFGRLHYSALTLLALGVVWVLWYWILMGI